MKARFRFGLTVAMAACIGLTGCNGSTTPAPGPTFSAIQHLYVADGATNGPLLQYALPITAASVPSATIASVPRSIGVAANASVVADAAVGGPIRVLNQPVSASSAVAASFGSFNTFPALGAAGQLYTSPGTTSLSVYTPPFTNSSAPSSTITFPIGVSSVAVDPNGNIYVNNGATGIAAATSSGTVTASITASGRFYREMAANATQLFAANVGGGIDVYALPLTNASTPAFTLTSSVNGPEGVALDANGNLYVANTNNNTITVYLAPISSASTASFSLALPGTVALFGIGIGP